jgi:hypothetical protein
VATLIDSEAFRTNGDNKDKRSSVMTPEECQFADKLLDWYRSAWMDKENRGLFEKWERMDLYWEGDANQPESDTDPASNTNIVNPNVEGQVAYLIEQNLAIQARGRGPSDVPFADTVRIILEFVKERNKMRRKLDVHERRRKKFGTGIFRVLFDPDMLDGMGLPWIEPCNPAYVFPDPNITDVYRINEGRFIIETMMKSISWARESGMYDIDRVNAIQPGYEPMETQWVFGEEDGESDEISRDHYLHMLVWFRDKVTVEDEDGKRTEWRMRLVEMSGDGIILRDTKDDPNFVIPGNRYPYFFTPDMYREGTVWGKGTAELLVDTQDLINDIDDQIRINARLTGNPQRWVNTQSGIDPDKVTNEGGLVIPTDIDGNNAIGYLTPPNMPQYIINRRDQALGIERQIQTRFSDQQAGIKQQGVGTATEALALQQGASAGVAHSKMLLEETLSDMFEYILELCMEYWTEEQAFRITERDDDFIFFRPSSLKEVPTLIPATDAYTQTFMRQLEAMGIPTDNIESTPKFMPIPESTKKAAFDISVTVGSGLPTNKAFVYTLIREAYRDGVLSPATYAKLLREYAGLPVSEEDVAALEKPPAPTGGQGGMEQMPNPLVAGLTPNNAPMQPNLSAVPGGVA